MSEYSVMDYVLTTLEDGMPKSKLTRKAAKVCKKLFKRGAPSGGAEVRLHEDGTLLVGMWSRTEGPQGRVMVTVTPYAVVYASTFISSENVATAVVPTKFKSTTPDVFLAMYSWAVGDPLRDPFDVIAEEGG